MKILLFGITDFCTNILDKLIRANYEVCGLVFNASNNVDIQEMKKIATAAKIPWFEAAKLKDPAFIAKIKQACQPDIVLVFTFDQLIPRELYSLAKIAAINMHPSDLPRYRGCHPYFWPIANGEKESALTFHYLTDEFDTGDIIAQEKMAIMADETSGMLIERQKQLSWKMLEPILTEIKKTQKAPAATPQPKGDFVKAPKVQFKDYFIDWSWPSQKIINRILALNPFSAAFTTFRKEYVGIYQVKAVDFASPALPGTIVALEPAGPANGGAGPVVKTGDGALQLLIMVVGRKYLLGGQDFIKNEKITLLERLG